jgi:tRNA (adenine22-N1)-methyltransferase
MKLSERLNAVKQYIPQGIVVADIGADRGELSLYLLQENIAKKVILTDISEKSLYRAKQLFAGKKEAENADFRVGDGLAVLVPGEAEYAVFAGMGGLTIQKILTNAPDVAASLQGLIIQAMGNSNKVRAYLHEIGFAIIQETMILEENQYYTIIYACPGQQVLSPTEIFAGPCLLAKSDPLLKAYLNEEKKKAQAVLDRLLQRGEGASRREELTAYLRQIATAEREMEGNKCT